MTLEACVGNLSEALNAERLGAHQIELCDRLDLDGTSPPLEMVRIVSRTLKIPVKVIINPNPYNYTYSTKDIDGILIYVEELNKLKINGIVFGPLTKVGLPDLEAIKIISETTSLPITYHKAIDISSNILQSIEMLVNQDIIKFILSSGGEQTAKEGVDRLLKMKENLENTSISLIAAGQITSKNIDFLHHQLRLSHYHGKMIVGNLKDSN